MRNERLYEMEYGGMIKGRVSERINQSKQHDTMSSHTHQKAVKPRMRWLYPDVMFGDRWYASCGTDGTLYYTKTKGKYLIIVSGYLIGMSIYPSEPWVLHVYTEYHLGETKKLSELLTYTLDNVLELQSVHKIVWHKRHVGTESVKTWSGIKWEETEYSVKKATEYLQTIKDSLKSTLQ